MHLTYDYCKRVSSSIAAFVQKLALTKKSMKQKEIAQHFDTYTIQSEKAFKSFMAVDFMYASSSTSLKTCFL